MVFTTKEKSVYSAVRTGTLNKAVCASSLKCLLKCEETEFRSCSLTLREEHQLKVPEKRAPTIFEPRRMEVTGYWRKTQ
jgi:hypothetical protein